MSRHFDRIINAALDRDGQSSSESLVVANHLAQMRSFGIRQGVEFFPIQDLNTIRKDFIEKLWKDNKIDLFLDRYWDLLLCKGRLLFYLRPGQNGRYRIFHYSKDQFQSYYDADGNLIEVVIKYSYKAGGYGHVISGMPQAEKWVKLSITNTHIVRYDSDFEPDISQQMGMDYQPSNVAVNTLGWIPCVIVNNYSLQAGQDGVDDFSWLASNIEAHDRMVRAIRSNIEFFGNPTLLSSRSLAELTEGGVLRRPQRPTAASESGFWGSTRSSYLDDPFERFASEDGLRVRRVIAGVLPDDRVGYIVPDPVSPDQTRFAAAYREDLHTALGGVDPNGISTGATAYEIKSLYGRTAATAKKRADNLYTYGLCKVIEMAIAAEELKLKRQIATVLEVPVEQITDDGVMLLLQTGKSPAGRKLPKDFAPIGLPPLGDREILWRWKGPVFEDSPQDILQRSIVVRNMEEVGVDTGEALRFMLPDKTEEEIRAMLTGFPFREMQEAGSALSQHASILGQLMAMPSPLDPNLPLAAQFNNLEVIARTIQHIQRRLDYGNDIQPAADSGAYAFTPVPSNFTNSPGGPSSINGTGAGQLPAGSAPVSAGNGAPVSTGAGPGQLYDLATGRLIDSSPAANAGIPSPANAGFANSLGGYQPTLYGQLSSSYGAATTGGPDFAAGLPIPGATIASQPAGVQPGPTPYDPQLFAGVDPRVYLGIYPELTNLLASPTAGQQRRQRSRNR
jgi:hypothetical protein